MNKHIFIGAHARSGSTFLCQLLSHYNSLKVFYELFHFNIEPIQWFLGEDCNVVFNTIKGITGRDLIRDDLVCNSNEYLGCLKRKYANQFIVFKQFPGHLPSPHLESVLEDSKLVILLKRNVLHSYISNQIANRKNSFLLVDNNDELVLFEKYSFMNHAMTVVDDFMKIQSYAQKRKIPLVCIDYESLIESEDKFETITEVLSPYLNDLSHSFGDKIQVKLQDSRQFASSKVRNPEEMYMFLRENKLEDLDNVRSRSDYLFLWSLTRAFVHI